MPCLSLNLLDSLILTIRYGVIRLCFGKQLSTVASLLRLDLRHSILAALQHDQLPYHYERGPSTAALQTQGLVQAGRSRISECQINEREKG